MILLTERLLLREPGSGDEDLFVRSLNDDDVRKYLGNNPYPFTFEVAEWFVEYCQEKCAMKNRVYYPFIMELGGEGIGEIGLSAVGRSSKDEKGSACLSYWLFKDFWGKGLMSEALDKIILFSFEDLNLDLLYAEVAKENTASCKLLERHEFVPQEDLPLDFRMFHDWNPEEDFLYVLRK